MYISDEVSIIKEVQRQLAKSAKEYAYNDREYTAVSLSVFHTDGCADAYRFLGCHCLPSGGAIFRVWAPRAESVSVVGEFNFWNEQDLPLQKVSDSVWEAFSIYAAPGGAYKYCVTGPDGRKVYKSDPYGTRCKALPDTSSLVEAEEAYPWHDGLYRSRRAKQNVLNRPLNIYEVHAGSWKRHPDGSVYNWDDLAAEQSYDQDAITHQADAVP